MTRPPKKPLVASWNPEDDKSRPGSARSRASRRGHSARRSPEDRSAHSANDHADSAHPSHENPPAIPGPRALNSHPRESRIGRFVGRGAWRVFAVAALLLVSAVAVFQIAQPEQAGLGDGDLAAGPLSGSDSRFPKLTEAPANQKHAPEIFSAELPDGGPIPERGAGTFETTPGAGPVVGAGQPYRYVVEVEHGVTLAEGNASFAHLVEQTLSDPRSWTNPQAKPGGISLQRVDAGQPADFRITLASQQTSRERCGFDHGLRYDTSCRVSGPDGDRVIINAARWVRGAISFEGDIGTYRKYAINHEVGHVFSNDHVGCPAPGALAPVMMQQTLSVANNELHQLNQQADQGGQIPPDGKVCMPNAWPFPVLR